MASKKTQPNKKTSSKTPPRDPWDVNPKRAQQMYEQQKFIARESRTFPGSSSKVQQGNAAKAFNQMSKTGVPAKSLYGSKYPSLVKGKGTGRSGGIVNRIPGMRGGFFGGLGSSGARFGRK